MLLRQGGSALTQCLPALASRVLPAALTQLRHFAAEPAAAPATAGEGTVTQVGVPLRANPCCLGARGTV